MPVERGGFVPPERAEIVEGLRIIVHKEGALKPPHTCAPSATAGVKEWMAPTLGYAMLITSSRLLNLRCRCKVNVSKPLPDTAFFPGQTFLCKAA